MAKKMIMVVDDDRVVQKIVRAALGQDNYDVLTVEDGTKAVDMARGAKPDAILLDRIMPDIDGNDILIALQAKSETADIPVIMLTSMGSGTDISESLELGARDYIVKPFDPGLLKMRLSKVLQRS